VSRPLVSSAISSGAVEGRVRAAEVRRAGEPQLQTVSRTL